MSTFGTTNFVHLFAAAEALGGSTPAAISVVLDSNRAFRDIAGPGVNLSHELLRRAVQGAVDSGQPLNHEDAWKAGKSAAVTQLVRKEVGEALGCLDYDCALLVRDLLRGDVGVEMFAGLQPTVDTAIQGIERAGGFYGPDSSLADVVELGAEAVAAWRQAQAHQSTLDQLLNTVLRPTRFLELIDPALLTDLEQYWLAAWFMPSDRAVSGGQDTPLTQREGLTLIGLELDRSSVAWKVPGGRWLYIFKLCGGLQLNNPQQAAELLRNLQNTQRDANFARYEGQTPRMVPDEPGSEDLPVPGGGDIGYSEAIN
jgi:hypothetical protein